MACWFGVLLCLQETCEQKCGGGNGGAENDAVPLPPRCIHGGPGMEGGYQVEQTGKEIGVFLRVLN